MTYENLKCSTCNYIPDQEDIDKTGYHLLVCSCGQKNVCDLCLFYEAEIVKKASINNDRAFNNSILSNNSKCPNCSSGAIRGNKRKFWLQDEYD